MKVAEFRTGAQPDSSPLTAAGEGSADALPKKALHPVPLPQPGEGMLAAGGAAKGWQARLDLRYESRGGRTVLAQRSHVGPLLVQRPFYPEGGICHSYIVHPPGGVVGGDELSVHVACAPAAHAVITTPAASKFYRSDGAIARQMQHIALDDAEVEWLPQETIYYPGARARATTRVQVAGQSRFLGWEVACLGLPACGQSFDTGALQLGFELWTDDTPRYLDRLQVRGGTDALTSAWGWAGHSCLGTMLAWPARREWLELARSVAPRQGFRSVAPRQGFRSVATEAVQLAVTLVDGVLVCRCLGQQAEIVRAALIGVWEVLRPELFGIAPVRPRIWAT